jgi:hypothetical protein
MESVEHTTTSTNTTIVLSKMIPLHNIIQSPNKTVETGEAGGTGEPQKSEKMKKRNRKHSAQILPQGFEHHMMKKYVVYYREWIDKSHTKEREYFKIEKHPDLPKIWTSSKSSKVKLTDKLAEANKIIDELEKKRKEELIEKQKIENY